MQQKQRRARAMDLVAVANATRLDMPLLDLGHNYLPMLFFRKDGPAAWDPTIADIFLVALSTIRSRAVAGGMRPLDSRGEGGGSGIARLLGERKPTLWTTALVTFNARALSAIFVAAIVVNGHSWAASPEDALAIVAPLRDAKLEDAPRECVSRNRNSRPHSAIDYGQLRKSRPLPQAPSACNQAQQKDTT